MELRREMERAKVPMSMVLVQSFTTAMMLISRVVLTEGMFVFSLLAYRNAIAALFIAPFAFFLEREMGRKLTLKALKWIFFNALLGITMALGLYYYGLRDTSAAYSCNLLNLIPIITFIIAILFGMERLRITSKEGKIKIFGTLLCIGGAMIFDLYKGKVLHLWSSHIMQLKVNQDQSANHWLRGTFLLIGSCFSYALWFITQAKLFKIYPSKYWTTMLTCILGSLQTFVIGIIISHKKEAWKLKWDLQLLAVVYSGILNTGATFCIISWAISQRGPTYPSMFNSLSVIFTTILESFLMGQEITIGSLLGMSLIFGGLYAFLWAKRKEYLMKKEKSGGERSVASEFVHSESVTIVPVLDKDELQIDVLNIDSHNNEKVLQEKG